MIEIRVTVEIPGLMELARAIAGVAAGQAAQPVQAQSALVTQQPAPQQYNQAPVTQATQAAQYNQAPVQSAPVAQQYSQAPVAQTAPAQQAPVAQTAPVQQSQQFAPAPAQQPAQPTTQPAAQPTAVPTTHATQQYTQDQVAIAMTQLMDAGKIDVVTGIMQQFGVQTLMQIPKDRYPELTVILRQAGAQI